MLLRVYIFEIKHGIQVFRVWPNLCIKMLVKQPSFDKERTKLCQAPVYKHKVLEVLLKNWKLL